MRDSSQHLKRMRRDIMGLGQSVLTGSGRRRPYVFLDNAASTPALKPVWEETGRFLNWYSGVHRGTGIKSLVSSRVYDECHRIVAGFVGADPEQESVIIVKNTTEAINKLAFRMQFQPGDVVVATAMEHHSNDLPWRTRARVTYARVDEKGQLDLKDLREKLRRNYPRVKLVTVCGASNVTGHINDIHHIAALAHEYGAMIMVDGAQLVPHQPVKVMKRNHPGHIDFLVFSGHKIYAPFGSGVIIGPVEFFSRGAPDQPGGGTVNMVTRREIIWAAPPDRDEAGSPNVIGAFALARSLDYLEKLGREKLASYEESLTSYAIKELNKVPGLKIYGGSSRVGVITFNLAGISHALVGAVLCYEAGIGIRTGCFCAQSYVRQLLGENEPDSADMKRWEHEPMPGMVRISLGAYNTREEIDYLVEWLQRIAAHSGELGARYHFCPAQAAFLPHEAGWEGNLHRAVQSLLRQE